MSARPWPVSSFILISSVRSDPVAVCPCPCWGTWFDGCPEFPEALEIITCPVGFFPSDFLNYLNRHYVLVEFLFFRPDFVFLLYLT